MIKKLHINIGGTSRSGSTLLGKILANDKNGMHLGEIRAIFNPTRNHHFDQIKKVKIDFPWSSIYEKGRNEMPNSIFQSFSQVDFLVDSSKNGFWIHKSNLLSKEQDITSKNVLIFKDPDDFACSLLKRGRKNWVSQYINYHRKFTSVVKSFYVVSYTSLMKNPKTLKKLCEWLGVEYSEDKFKYWENEEKGFFGSSTPNNRKSISYEKNIPKEYQEQINNSLANNKELRKVWYFLQENENKEVSNATNISYSRLKLFVLQLRNKGKLLYRSFYPENYFKD